MIFHWICTIQCMSMWLTVNSKNFPKQNYSIVTIIPSCFLFQCLFYNTQTYFWIPLMQNLQRDNTICGNKRTILVQSMPCCPAQPSYEVLIYAFSTTRLSFAGQFSENVNKDKADMCQDVYPKWLNMLCKKDTAYSPSLFDFLSALKSTDGDPRSPGLFSPHRVGPNVVQ